MAKNLNLEEDDNTVHEGNDVRRWHFSAVPTNDALAAVGTLGVALAPLRVAESMATPGQCRLGTA
jgi:uncharacterized protein (DUF111 family)